MLDTQALELKGKCKYHELLYWDGDPKKLELGRPHGVSIHPKTGDIYIADSDNNRILKIVKGK